MAIKYYILNTQSKEYFKFPGEGSARNIKQAHPYTYNEAKSMCETSSNLTMGVLFVDTETSKEMYYIKSCNSGYYWRSNRQGYTDNIEEAGVYPEEEAFAIKNSGIDVTLIKKQEDQWDEATRGKKMSASTGRVIFKYQMPVLEEFTMKLPRGAEIIRMADQGGMFWLWAVVDTREPDEIRKFYAVKCGANVPEKHLIYRGFCAIHVQQELGLYIFEAPNETE